ncbi:hypothetical protein [Cellulomonas shaoxiangyii]|uniref:Integral membrane protein n=1 Tax=Cellulomonas shaoxiangyii TaxID=2566013 RepID=A0A4P7SGZ1_9CELL|nr:hypothetical protein [Cellulomonas shaoxiangyii]QCB92356.1 hypothetical protein E5225_01070 [Cellulomonas shaoxiangyii]TGY86250.1 hypothetical protein E5226_02795 [Cellulomonas shaoxiangyii]
MPDAHRSAGLVPAGAALDGLTEIRVHGVGGTGPESLLGDLTPTRVGGDRIAGFYRTSDVAGRHREAYSWGGMTSHSPLRALWMFLVPAMFANMAGWMARRWVTSGEDEVTQKPTMWLFRWFARLSALSLTLAATAMSVLLFVDVVAYQCGAIAGCGATGWWTGAVERWAGADEPGNRVGAGAAVSALLAVGVFLLAGRTRRAYESVEPPSLPGAGTRAGARTPKPSCTCAAAREGGLRNEHFWSGRVWHQFLSQVHLAACLAVVTLYVGGVVAGLGAGTVWGTLGWVSVGVAAASVLAVMGLLARDRSALRASATLLVVTTAGLLLAGFAAVALPAGAGPAGMAPGARTAVNWAWGVALGLLVPLAAQQVGAWVSRRRKERSGGRSPRLELFPWAAPFVMNAVALLIANAVLLSVIVWVARALAPVEWGFGPTDPGVAAGVIYLPTAIGSIASVLSLGLVGMGLAFGLVFAVRYVVARGAWAPRVEAELREAYAAARAEGAGIADGERDASDDGGGETNGHAVVASARNDAAWWRSAFDGPAFEVHARRVGRPSAWVRKVAGMRFVASHSRDVAWLLVAVTVAGVIGAVTFLVRVWLLRAGTPIVLPEIGITLAVLLPPAYVGVLLLMWRRERWRKALGSVFDVGTFFPRSFHPFAPPSYAERAVPELTRRIWRLHDNGGRVVLTAHSQGSVLAAAVVGRTSTRDDEPTIGLVTVGSPLGKLYRWAFPALFTDGFLDGIAHGRPGIGPVAWTNVYYATDYVGGAVRTAESVVPRGADTELVDPPTDQHVVDQPLPPVLSHTGYWVDPAFWRCVDATCDAVQADAAARNGVPHGIVRDRKVIDPEVPLRYL